MNDRTQRALDADEESLQADPVDLEGLSEAIVHTIREPLMILDQRLRVRFANPAFYRAFRIAPEETVDRTLFELGSGQWDSARLRELLEDVLPENAVVEDFAVELDFPGEGRRSMLLSARRLERAGRPLILLAVQDTTERLRALQDLERSNQELERFAYVASHDLQEPLRMVASYTRLLQKRYQGQLDERADKYIAYAVEGAERMRTLIQDLLAYSRVGTQGTELVATDPNEVLAEVLRDFALRIQEVGATVTREPIPGVMADPSQLRLVLQNLVENALKFSGDEPPVVHVAGRREGPQVVICVRDEGVGIDPEYFEQVFVIFRRLQGRDEKGTGIGLALCKRIVERHGGRLWVESEAGSGATFRFTLPAREPVAAPSTGTSTGGRLAKETA